MKNEYKLIISGSVLLLIPLFGLYYLDSLGNVFIGVVALSGVVFGYMLKKDEVEEQ